MEATAELFLADGFEPTPGEGGAEGEPSAAAGGGWAAQDADSGEAAGGEQAGSAAVKHTSSSGRVVQIEELDC